MTGTILILVSALLAFYPVESFAQDRNFWGDAFDCGVDWFGGCVSGKAIREKGTDRPKEAQTGRRNASSLLGGPNAANLPPPVRNVLENPSPESARAYVVWSKEASQRLAKASEYIAQATREINSEDAMFRNETERTNEIAFAGMGPVGLYYFFSPGDQSPVEDVKVLNKIWREGRLGVVGIPLRGKDDEVVSYVNEAKPLFPIRRSDTEVNLVRPTETPDLYVALPLQKKIFRLGQIIKEMAIKQALEKVVEELSGGRSALSALESDR